MHEPEPRDTVTGELARLASCERPFVPIPTGACPTLNRLGRPPLSAEVIDQRWRGDGAELEASEVPSTPTPVTVSHSDAGAAAAALLACARRALNDDEARRYSDVAERITAARGIALRRPAR